jgi:hypothetical protein
MQLLMHFIDYFIDLMIYKFISLFKQQIFIHKITIKWYLYNL